MFPDGYCWPVAGDGGVVLSAGLDVFSGRGRFVHLLPDLFAGLFDRGSERVADTIPIDEVRRIRARVIDDENHKHGQDNASHHS
jgi:hypothetical protein